MGSKWWQVTVASAVVAAALGVAAGPVGAAAKPGGKLGAYCTQLEQLGQEFGDPGIDAIFEDNPNPTLADWAAFLPGPIARMNDFVSGIEALDAPTAAAPAVKLALRRWHDVVDHYESGRQAAAEGDQKTFDSLEGRRDPLVKKLGKAMTKVAKVCGVETDG